MPTKDQALADVREQSWFVHGAHDKHEDRIITAYKAGASLAEIAAATEIDGNGIGQFTEEGVRRLLRRHGVQLRPRGRPAH